MPKSQTPTTIVTQTPSEQPPKQSLEKWLADWEQQHQTWSEYYHCCGGY